MRVELGPNDLKKEQLVAVRRDTGEKITIELTNKISGLKKLLDDIQENLLRTATEELNQHIVILKDWNHFCTALDNKNIILAPFCEEESCEDNIKKDSARFEPYKKCYNLLSHEIKINILCQIIDKFKGP